jgi:hypothetical protein
MRSTFTIGVTALVIGATAAAGWADNLPHHVLPKPKNGGTVVGLCDGETAKEVKVAPGTALAPAEAQKVSDELMAEWRRKHPEANWDEVVAQSSPAAKPASNEGHGPGTGRSNAPPSTPSANTSEGIPKQKTTATKAPAGTRPKDQSGVYGDYSTRDELVWKSETEKFVTEGNAIFHDAKRLGGTVGISCDMCHPNGSNTHPETYPKYQVQLQRVALLRDMINWCLENPVKAQALPDDSVKMRALEAYIIAQRKGQKLDYGKH